MSTALEGARGLFSSLVTHHSTLLVSALTMDHGIWSAGVPGGCRSFRMSTWRDLNLKDFGILGCPGANIFSPACADHSSQNRELFSLLLSVNATASAYAQGVRGAPAQRSLPHFSPAEVKWFELRCELRCNFGGAYGGFRPYNRTLYSNSYAVRANDGVRTTTAACAPFDGPLLVPCTE